MLIEGEDDLPNTKPTFHSMRGPRKPLSVFIEELALQGHSSVAAIILIHSSVHLLFDLTSLP